MNNNQGLSSLWKLEDWWAVWFGTVIIIVALAGITGKAPKLHTWLNNPTDTFYQYKRSAALETKPADLEIGKSLAKVFSYDSEKKALVLKGVLSEAKRDHLKTLSADPAYKAAVDEIYNQPLERTSSVFMSLLWMGLALAIMTAIGLAVMGEKPGKYIIGFIGIFILAVIAELIAKQNTIEARGLGYAFWALLFGLLISNTIGTPKFLLNAAKTELFIKTGLVLLGAEILFGKILEIGAPGLFVAWLVTPVVIIFMYWFGVRILKMSSRGFVITVAAATSVCGVSAAIATAAACRAKKEELTLAVGMSLIFTVLMMIFMPVLIKMMGMSVSVGAAWMGGTIDATGAVVLAGSVLGTHAEAIAAVVKMIQNILIGLVAFCVAVYWVTRVDRDPDPNAPKPSMMEIWYRFPKFIIGFIAASLVFSFVITPIDSSWASDAISSVTKTLRGWLFCLAFISIGLESNFRELAKQLVGGKPITLYIIGQSFNLILTLIAAYLAFGGILFDVPKA